MPSPIAIDPHDLYRLRSAGAFLLLRRGRGGRARVLASGAGDPVASGLTPSMWSKALAAGCDEALVIACPCPVRRMFLAERLTRLERG